MISLRTALCLSGLMVIATGSAALDTSPDSVSESKSPTSTVLTAEAHETPSISPEASAHEQSAAQAGGENVAEPAPRE